jgi:hypothetical protein
MAAEGHHGDWSEPSRGSHWLAAGAAFTLARSGALAAHEYAHVLAACMVGRARGALTRDNLITGAFVKHRVRIPHNQTEGGVEDPAMSVRACPPDP